MQRRLLEARTLHRIASHAIDVKSNMPTLNGLMSVSSRLIGCFQASRHSKKGTSEFLPRYIGHFQVYNEVSKDPCELALLANRKIHDTFHVSMLDRYHHDGSRHHLLPRRCLKGGDRV